jgi:RNA polymerase sigma-32 factor
MLSANEERDLVRAWQDHGDARARDTLIRAFAPMAAAKAKQFSPASQEA